MGSTKPEASTSDGGGGMTMGLKEIFKSLGDENGRVTSARLKSYVKELELDFSDAEIKEMMDVVDPSGKGEITYKGLVGIVRDFNHEFPSVELTPEEMKRELTVVLEEESTTLTESVDEQTEGGESRPESTKSGNGGGQTQDDGEDKVPEEDGNSPEVIDEEEPEQEEEEEEHEETPEVDDDVTDDVDEDDESDNQTESEVSSQGTISKPPTRMSYTIEHRLDSAISTAVSKMVDDDSKSVRSTNSKRTMRGRSKSESSIPTRRGSTSSTKTTTRKSSTTGNQPVRKLNRSKSVFKPVREPEYYSTVGCSLKLSQIRMKQRLLYIMWRVVYDQAVKKMQAEKQRQMAARRQSTKKGVKKRMSVTSK